MRIEFVESPPIDTQDLRRAHEDNYIQAALRGELSAESERLLGFHWSESLVERARRSAGGTLAAACAALTDGVAVNLAGGTHHAKRDTGAGYCLFNDIAITALWLTHKGPVARILIVDADVHQGDGTAEILCDEPTIYTFSIHGQKNFPRRKARSDLDIGLADGCGDEAYLRAFQGGLRQAFLAARPTFVL